MGNNYYLTPSEQRVLEIMNDVDHIEKKTLIELCKMNIKNLDLCLTSLVKKGEIFRLKRGFYIRTGDRGFNTTLFQRAAPLAYGGYIAFDTALKIYFLLDYEPFTLMVATPKHSGIVEMGQYEVHFTSLGDRCQGRIQINGIWVSDIEKTLFDCFYKPELSGGYVNITKALYQVEDFSWTKFSHYLHQYGTDPLRQRVGFITSRLFGPNPDDEIDEFLKGLKPSVKTPTRLSPTYQSSSTYDKEWKVQDNLGKSRWGSWMGRY